MIKVGKETKIIDKASPYFGKVGEVIATATTLDYQGDNMAVSVRFEKGNPTVWFHANQLS